MKYKTILVDKHEFDLLKRIMSMGKHDKSASYGLAISKLRGELDNAKIVPAGQLPSDVVRFNSKVNIETPFITKIYQVVTPEKSDLANDKISILAPMGLALFGYAKGDELTWDFPNGKGTIKILDVEQENSLEWKQETK